MGVKFWLDDVRPAPDGEWVWRRDFKEAVEWLKIAKLHEIKIDIAQLDHDLGGEAWNFCTVCDPFVGDEEIRIHGCEHTKTGRHVVEWMEENDFWPKQIVIHSWNPFGANRMASIAARHTETFIQPFGMVERKKVLSD